MLFSLNEKKMIDMRCYNSYFISSCVYIILIMLYSQQIVAQTILVDENMSDRYDIPKYAQESSEDFGNGEFRNSTPTIQ